MRLINANTMELEEFQDSRIPRYAILSHTWEENSEILFQDMQKIKRPKTKPGYTKIRYACQQARKDLLSHVWVDTCCIDKRSSAELQEAINSMYRYYSRAATCYVYLADIPLECPQIEDNVDIPYSWFEMFKASRWFTRGWTLQELIAPLEVEFFGREWNYIGKKSKLIQTIWITTTIDPSILTHEAIPASMSIAQRMSWAARRQTSREEDRAYSLLGLFNVSMPMLYGEGPKAFIRLQEEILKASTDHSIFAWEFEDEFTADGSLLAASPANFAYGQRIVQWGKPGEFQMTNRGLRISLSTLDYSRDSDVFAILNCRYANDLTKTLALRLRRYSSGEEYHAIKGSRYTRFETHLQGRLDSRLVFIPVEDLHFAREASPLQITRETEFELSRIKFWIRNSSRAISPFRIVEAHPKTSWDMNDGTVHAGNAPSERFGITIMSSSGYKYNFAFGYDSVIQPRESEQDRILLIPGIWGSAESHPGGLSTLIQRCFSSCRHFSHSCLQGHCSRMPGSVTLTANYGLEKLETSIFQATIMNETVFVVTVRIDQIFELETVEGIVEMDVVSQSNAENQVVDTRTALFVAEIEHYLGLQVWSDKVRDIIRRERRSLASTNHPLKSELGPIEMQPPVQVWTSVPEGMHLLERYPADARILRDQGTFWAFEECQFATGGIAVRSTNGTTVFILFNGWDDGTIETDAFETAWDPASEPGLFQHETDFWLFRKDFQIKPEPGNSAYVSLPADRIVLRITPRNANVVDTIAYVIDIAVEKQILEEEESKADFDSEGQAEGQADGLKWATVGFSSGDRSWNTAGTRDSTFRQTNVLNA